MTAPTTAEVREMLAKADDGGGAYATVDRPADVRVEVLRDTALPLAEERDGVVKALVEKCADLRAAVAERDRLAAKLAEMHRRAQAAESIVAQSGIVEGRPQEGKGRSLGRALANYAAAMYLRERDEAVARAERAERERDEARNVLRRVLGHNDLCLRSEHLHRCHTQKDYPRAEWCVVCDERAKLDEKGGA